MTGACRDGRQARYAAAARAFCRSLYWTIRRAGGIRATSCNETVPRPDEAILAQNVHMVERPDLRHAIVDLAVRRTGRRGRAGQPLLPHQGRQDRSHAPLPTPLGGL